MSKLGIRTDNNDRIAVVLFSRCLEHGKWPDRIEFTKYLYLLDYANYRIKGEQLTNIRWKFFHYGPWSEDIIPVMDSVQNHFRLGWVDYSTEQRDVPAFDLITESLGVHLEALILKIIRTFSKRDASFVVDYCYRLTEPMENAVRGEYLNFTVIPVNGLSDFIPQIKTIALPQLSEQQMAAREKLRAKIRASSSKIERWKQAMETSEYKTAMAIMAKDNEYCLPQHVSALRVKLSPEAISEIISLKHV